MTTLRGYPLTILAVLLCLAHLGTAQARDLTFGIRYPIPPYVMEHLDQTHPGIEVEILRAALARVGHRATVRFLPANLWITRFQEGAVDGVLNVPEPQFPDAYYSDVVIHFHNSFISLDTKGIQGIDKLEDVMGYEIVAFPQAARIIGGDFQRMAEASSNYREIGHQKLQLRLLYSGRADLVFMDRRIFRHLRRELEQELASGNLPVQLDTNQAVVYHDVLPRTPYRFVFREQDIRDDFNHGLRAIREDSTYQHILDRYGF